MKNLLKLLMLLGALSMMSLSLTNCQLSTTSTSSSSDSSDSDDSSDNSDTGTTTTVSSSSLPNTLLSKARFTNSPQVLGDYACAMKSNTLNCWNAFEAPADAGDAILLKNVDKYVILSQKDLNNKSTNTNKFSLGLALTKDNVLYGWGENTAKLIYSGSATDKLSLTLIARDIKEVQILGQTACVLKKDNTITCWGNNQRGLGRNVASATAAVSYSSKDDDLILGSNDKYNQFKSFKMAGQSGTAKDAFPVMICGLNNDEKLYCWGDVSLNGFIIKSTGGTYDCPIYPEDREGVYEVKVKSGNEYKSLEDVKEYEITEIGNAMYVKGKKSSKEDWYVFGKRYAPSACTANDTLATTSPQGALGTDKLFENPLRMIAEDKEEDTSSVKEFFLGTLELCLVTSKDLLRCTFATHALIDTANTNTKKEDFQTVERETNSSSDTDINATWFTAYGDDDTKVKKVYQFGDLRKNICVVLKSDSELDCLFELSGMDRKNLKSFHAHKDAFCLIDTDEALHCQKGVSGTVVTEKIEDSKVDIQNVFIGGDKGEEFFLAQADDDRVYGWNTDGSSTGDYDDKIDKALNGKTDTSGFGDIDTKGDDNDDVITDLSNADLDEIYVGTSYYVLGKKSDKWYEWGYVSSSVNGSISVDDDGDSNDYFNLKFRF